MCPQKEALGLCDNLVNNVQQVESLTDLDLVTPDVEDSERHHLHLVTRDVVHQYFMFGFEVLRDLSLSLSLSLFLSLSLSLSPISFLVVFNFQIIVLLKYR